MNLFLCFFHEFKNETTSSPLSVRWKKGYFSTHCWQVDHEMALCNKQYVRAESSSVQYRFKRNDMVERGFLFDLVTLKSFADGLDESLSALRGSVT